MSQANVVLKKLTEIRLNKGADSVVLCRASQRCTLLKNGGDLGEMSFFEFIQTVLYGTGNNRQIGEGSVSFSGSKSVTVTRDLISNKATIKINGNEIKLKKNQTPGSYLFGLNMAAFTKAVLVDGRSFIIGAGQESLRAHIQQQFIPQLEEKKPVVQMEVTEDLGEVRSKRIALEKQLQMMPEPSTQLNYEPVDPPAIGELLKALEQTREIEKRLLERRIRLNEEFKNTKSKDQTALLPATAPILCELEKIANEMDSLDAETNSYRSALSQGVSFAVRASIIIALMMSCGAAAIGQILDEPLLTYAAIVTVVAAIGGVIWAWVKRMNRIVLTTKKAKATTKRRRQLRDKAAKLCLRVGTAASGEDLNPESIRTLVDRIGRRDMGRFLNETIAPYVDTDEELSIVRTLAKALESPLSQAAEIRDSKLPAVPLVRVTQSVMSILSDWSHALEESGKRVENAVSAQVRQKIEREMVVQALEKLKATEKTLALNGNKTKKASKTTNTPTARLAQHLNHVFVPLLQRYLGAEAPELFLDDLMPKFKHAPSSTTNSLVALILRLFYPADQLPQIPSIGHVVLDLGLAVGKENEKVLGQLLASSPICGPILLSHSRPELEHSMTDSLAMEMIAMIGISEVEKTHTDIDSTLYSGHDHFTPQAASGALNVLLKSSSH